MSANKERFQKLNVSAETTIKLRTLKARTGLTPNITARLGLAMSLDEPGRPNPATFATDGMEFNSYTLLGPYSSVIEALLRQRLHEDGADPDQPLSEALRAHVNRGVSLVYPRIKAIENLADLLPRAEGREGASNG